MISSGVHKPTTGTQMASPLPVQDSDRMRPRRPQKPSIGSKITLSSIFAPVYRDNNLYSPVRRRLTLLLSVLPSFAAAATQQKRSSKMFSTTRKFWTEFLSPCLLIELNGWNFHELDIEHQEDVGSLLSALEDMVNMEKSAIDKVIRYPIKSLPSF